MFTIKVYIIIRTCQEEKIRVKSVRKVGAI